VRDSLQVLKEIRSRQVVTTFRLNGLNNHNSNWPFLHLIVIIDELAHTSQTLFVLPLVVLQVILVRVLVHRKVSDRPVMSRNVKFVDGLGVSGGQHAQSATVEGALERQNTQVRTPGPFVHHTVRQVFGGRCPPAPLFIIIIIIIYFKFTPRR